MKATERTAFLDLLERTFATFGKPMPPNDVLEVWWAKLELFPIDAVARALSKHIGESEFAPVPASILKHLPKQIDGHLHPDAAWAIAARAADERNTIVWTEEIAQAWNAVSNLVDGSESGLRMAFRAAYTDILERSRGANKPAKWTVTLGFDVQQREIVVGEAFREGRLSLAYAQAAVPMLAGPAETPPTVNVEANLARLKALVSGIGSAKARAAAEKSRHAREDAEQLAEAKQAIASRVAGYEGRKS